MDTVSFMRKRNYIDFEYVHFHIIFNVLHMYKISIGL
jgi:hypothetical protein